MRIRFIFLILTVLVFTSCKDKETADVYWGKTTIYKNFLFKKYKPVRMEKTLELDFNKDAQSANSKVCFGLFKKDDKDNFTEVKDTEAQIYVDDVVCDNNTFCITTNNKNITVGIEIYEEAKDGTNKWFLQTTNYSNLDRIDNVELQGGNTMYSLDFLIKKNTITNPLKLASLIFIGSILLLLLLWKLVMQRSVHPTFKVGMVSFAGEDFRTTRIKGARKLICSSTPKKQSAINKFFCGKIVYDINPFWTKDWVIEPRNLQTIKPQGANYSLNPYSVVIHRGEEYEVTNNENNNKITLTYI